ncbi:Hypp2790 [Branchiostoma lanceolatum]|uniref:Mitochondria-eating protein n=1 Tax=Branchiostoma lanceolatum TaxID=7740 RepID=A0A8J9ZV02_BRALA|nr:Hypp2790 [Branchiostoma lanceolatum]
MSVPENWQTRASRDWPSLHRIGTVCSPYTRTDITYEVNNEVGLLLQKYYYLSDVTETLRQQCETLLRQQQKDANTCQELRSRLSKRMDDGIAMNELSLENTSPRSRPSNLAIRYQELETVEWLAAKEELDSAHSCGKELVTQYLCDVFVEAMRISKETLKLFTNSLSRMLLEPVQEMGKKDPVLMVVAAGQVSNQSAELTDKQQDLQRKVDDIIKERSDKCNIDDIIKRVEECIRNKERYQRHIGTIPSGRKKLETYITECCRLAWRMNVQTPAMAISVETDVPFDPALQDRAYDCESFGDATEVIDYYVWPTLFDAENHLPVRKKGRVYTKRKEPESTKL